MKTLKLSCLASVAALALSLTAAQADPVVNGTVNVDGYVTASCTVTSSVGAGGLWGTINLGELDEPTTGLLKSSLGGSTAQGNTVQVTVVCNSANPTIGLTATRLTDGVSTTGLTGYTSTVDYTAQVDVAKATTGTFTTTYLTGSSTQLPSVNAPVGAPLATTANNVTVSVNSLTASGVLTAGSYTSTISITITPS